MDKNRKVNSGHLKIEFYPEEDFLVLKNYLRGFSSLRSKELKWKEKGIVFNNNNKINNNNKMIH